MSRPVTPGLEDFLVQHIPEHPRDITQLAASAMSVSRQTVTRHLRRLAERGVVEADGTTRARSYRLTEEKVEIWYEVGGIEEDRIWTDDLLPHLADISPSVVAIAAYGVTEMINNVRDHSGADTMNVDVIKSARDIRFRVFDNGVGVFSKIKEAFSLGDAREAAIELSKGKLTTDPTNHSGEGIFFTSRAFDNFSILANGLYWYCSYRDRDWLIEGEESEDSSLVAMKIRRNSRRTLRGVFAEFQSPSGGFRKTDVPVILAQVTDEHLVSRSAAKRLLGRLERFDDVYLNFAKVPSIGQAFADEIFRVFVARHPEVRLHVVNANTKVKRMIAHVEDHG